MRTHWFNIIKYAHWSGQMDAWPNPAFMSLVVQTNRPPGLSQLPYPALSTPPYVPLARQTCFYVPSTTEFAKILASKSAACAQRLFCTHFGRKRWNPKVALHDQSSIIEGALSINDAALSESAGAGEVCWWGA